ncbi:hypothetical protein DFP93_11462 [Aneurinibacillus soli]|uniref:Uncharacterized protein n=1 Tax=Aneurinibacillus soli TaxID=1500254 RepID=A0A0U5AWN7_9BACL|nr:hypothetical protein [Aneurinibacillus soli]PYE60127.1 hypothetical protein DFP93_11462 [Aneurinibacillus soli]BAU26384.1 hypothetical protein CB4_00511 [Aneurinibacillus soli]
MNLLKEEPLQKGLLYDGRYFQSHQEMIETLLHEINKQIIRIDMGDLQNRLDHRNYIRFRLVHLQHVFNNIPPQQYRSTYNSLWSHLYRLEHLSTGHGAYLRGLLEKLLAAASK